jgi:hypothetical protein
MRWLWRWFLEFRGFWAWVFEEEPSPRPTVVPDMSQTIALLEPSSSPLTVLFGAATRRRAARLLHIRTPGVTLELVPEPEYVRWLNVIEPVPKEERDMVWDGRNYISADEGPCADCGRRVFHLLSCPRYRRGPWGVE